jgi:hypothetical protein
MRDPSKFEQPTHERVVSGVFVGAGGQDAVSVSVLSLLLAGAQFLGLSLGFPGAVALTSMAITSAW